MLLLAWARLTCPLGAGGILPMKELALRQNLLVPVMLPAPAVGEPAPGDPLEPLAAGAELEPHAHSARHAPTAAADSACWPRRIMTHPSPVSLPFLITAIVVHSAVSSVAM
jgi:hypothetical protein